ncbi:Uncharacterised protein [Chromobacterium violaceum]|uniref:Uncharacterized protein n=1 Tax=Chromobacterium violaceum TaxID=536 RepID=A0A3S4HQ50_CHRVL|nr:Uncharacterised protein [Chromobacterium violaceum]
MHDLQFVREHKSQINHALKPFHPHHLRYVPGVCADDAELVLLISPSPTHPISTCSRWRKGWRNNWASMCN